MAKYARLNDGNFELAPAVIKVGGKTYRGGIPKSVYLEAGYYPIVTVPKPEHTVEDGWEIVDQTIRQKYRPYTPDEEDEISRMVILSGDEAEEYASYQEDIAPVLEEVFG